MSRGRIVRVLLIIISFVLTVSVIMSGEYFKRSEDIKVGAVSSKRFIAPRETENVFATERKKDEIRNSIEPLYKQDTKVGEQAVIKVESLFDNIEETRRFIEEQKKIQNEILRKQESAKPMGAEDSEEFEDMEKEVNQDIKEYSIEDIIEMTKHQLEEYKKQSPISLSHEEFEFLIKMNSGDRNELENQCISAVETTFSMGIREETKTKNILDVKEHFENLNMEDNIKIVGYDIVASVIRANMIIDEDATYKMLEEKLQKVEPVIILNGQKIVDEGEIVTDEIYSILNDLGFIKKDFKESTIQYIGIVLLIVILQSFVYAYIWFFNKSIVESRKEMLLLFSIYSISIIMIRFMSSLDFAWIPIPIAGMLLAILLDVRLGIILNGYITIVGVLINKEGLSFMIFFLIVGTIFSMLVMNTYKRNRILWVGFIAGALNAVTLLSIEMFLNNTYTPSISYICLYGFISGVLAVIITVGSLPFWEVAFDVVTPIKLLELTNPDQPLLKRLLIEAPGTYHHSLVVANLAETAAADIGANPLLAKVGSYYHDIGKIIYPQYFKENQALDNPHDYMESSVSAKIIQQHITNGIKMASEYKLPRAIKDMITQHHGTTLIQYFYHKAIKIGPEEEISKADFSYEGPIPQSKEAAIIMLADTAEAAVRSMEFQDKNKEKNEELVRKLVKSKLDEGQLDDSNLTIKDLEMIIQAFMKVFNGMYHERIKYPEKLKEKNSEYSNGK